MRFSAEEWDAMVANEENLTLVGRFVKEIPHLDTIRRTVYASLHLEGGVQVASLNRRTILLRFDLEFDCRKIWLRRAMLEGARVSPIHTRRAIRVRLVRSYEVPELRGRAISKSKECLFHDEEIRILTRNRGQKWTVGVLIDVILQKFIQFHGHVMKNIANTLRNKADIRGLTPDKEVKRHIKELAAVIGGRVVPFGEPNVRFKLEERAPGGVVPEKLPAEEAPNPRVETIDVVRRRSEPHLSIRMPNPYSAIVPPSRLFLGYSQRPNNKHRK
nr:protein FAR1-RELATED SEQUENCE 5-like [Ipomoea batatas]